MKIEINQRAISFLILVLLIGSGVYFGMKQKKSTLAQADRYKAVYLTNGQVYFGKVKDEKADPVVMTDVFYPQVQPGGKDELQLVKRGNEAHAPEDEIRFNRDLVIMFETLKDDGLVVRSIKAHHSNGNQTPPNANDLAPQTRPTPPIIPSPIPSPTPSASPTKSR